MKTLLLTALLFMSFNAYADRVRICNQYGMNCYYIQVNNQSRYRAPQPIRQFDNSQLLDNISNSGAKNFDKMYQGWTNGYRR